MGRTRASSSSARRRAVSTAAERPTRSLGGAAWGGTGKWRTTREEGGRRPHRLRRTRAAAKLGRRRPEVRAQRRLGGFLHNESERVRNWCAAKLKEGKREHISPKGKQRGGARLRS
jgi:hypothetical protein